METAPLLCLCGAVVVHGAKFCYECGQSVISNETEHSNQEFESKGLKNNRVDRSITVKQLVDETIRTSDQPNIDAALVRLRVYDSDLATGLPKVKASILGASPNQRGLQRWEKIVQEDRKAEKRKKKNRISRAEAKLGIPPERAVSSIQTSSFLPRLPGAIKTSASAPHIESRHKDTSFEYRTLDTHSEWNLSEEQKKIASMIKEARLARNNFKAASKRSQSKNAKVSEKCRESATQLNEDLAALLEADSRTAEADCVQEPVPTRLSELHFTTHLVDQEVEQHLKDLFREADEISQQGSLQMLSKIEGCDDAIGKKAASFQASKALKKNKMNKQDLIKMKYTELARTMLKKTKQTFPLSDEQQKAIQEGGLHRGEVVFVSKAGVLYENSSVPLVDIDTLKPKVNVKQPIELNMWTGNPTELWKNTFSLRGINVEIAFVVQPLPKDTLLLRRYTSLILVLCYQLEMDGSRSKIIFEEEVLNEEMQVFTLKHQGKKEWIDPYRTDRDSWRNGKGKIYFKPLCSRVTPHLESSFYTYQHNGKFHPAPVMSKMHQCPDTDLILRFDRTAYATAVRVPFGPSTMQWHHPMVVRIKFISIGSENSKRKKVSLGFYFTSVWKRPWRSKPPFLFFHFEDKVMIENKSVSSGNILDMVALEGIEHTCSKILRLFRLENTTKGIQLTYLGKELDGELLQWPEEKEDFDKKTKAAIVIQTRQRGIAAKKRCKWIRMENEAKRRLHILKQENELRRKQQLQIQNAFYQKSLAEKKNKEMEQARRKKEEEEQKKCQLEANAMGNEDLNILLFHLDSYDALISEPSPLKHTLEAAEEFTCDPESSSDSDEELLEDTATFSESLILNGTSVILIAKLTGMQTASLEINIQVRDLISNQTAKLSLKSADLQISPTLKTDPKQVFKMIKQNLTLFFSRQSNIMVLSYKKQAGGM